MSTLEPENTAFRYWRFYSLAVFFVLDFNFGACSYFLRSQLEFSARAKELSSDTQVAVKDVRYVDCHRDFVPSSGELK